LGIGPNPQSPIPNPHLLILKYLKKYVLNIKKIKFKVLIYKKINLKY